jgi:hypothetical protein
MSKIDDTQAAITSAKEKLDETIHAINAAMQEAEEAQDVLSTAGAETNAEVLGQCKDALLEAAQAASGINDTLDAAMQHAEAGKG